MPGSLDAARAAAGTARAAIDQVMAGEGDVAYALVRPPGHHAAPGVADGYCFLNNTALCAQRARDAGAARVAVIDWNVHHGNGTQEGFYERDDVLTVSLHMDHGAWGPSHPQTGKADEIGRGRGRGFNLNVPLPMGSGDEGYARVFEELVVPAVDNFGPEMIVVAWPGRQPVRPQRPPAAVDGRVQAPRRARPGARRRPRGRGRLCLV